MCAKPRTDGLSVRDVRLRQFEQALTVRIMGLALEVDEEFASGLRAIRHCLCVQDAPANPCQCKGPLLWVPEGAIVSERPCGRTDEEGRELKEFAVRRDAQLIVERPTSIRADIFLRQSTLFARPAGNPPLAGRKPPRVVMKGEASDEVPTVREIGSALLDVIDEAVGGGLSEWGERLEELGDALEELGDRLVDIATKPIGSLVPQ
jgi:hypothetical protein